MNEWLGEGEVSQPPKKLITQTPNHDLKYPKTVSKFRKKVKPVKKKHFVWLGEPHLSSQYDSSAIYQQIQKTGVTEKNIALNCGRKFTKHYTTSNKFELSLVSLF